MTIKIVLKRKYKYKYFSTDNSTSQPKALQILIRIEELKAIYHDSTLLFLSPPGKSDQESPFKKKSCTWPKHNINPRVTLDPGITNSYHFTNYLILHISNSFQVKIFASTTETESTTATGWRQIKLCAYLLVVVLERPAENFPMNPSTSPANIIGLGKWSRDPGSVITGSGEAIRGVYICAWWWLFTLSLGKKNLTGTGGGT